MMLSLFICLFFSAVFSKLPYEAQQYITVEFSVERGFYKSPFNLTLSTSTKYANLTTIRYRIVTTGNGLLTAFAEANEKLYAGPILINTTCVVQARAYVNVGVVINGTVPNSYVNFRTSDHHTFLFADNIMNQPYMRLGSLPAGANTSSAQLMTLPSLLCSSVNRYPAAAETVWTGSGIMEWIDPGKSSDNCQCAGTIKLSGGCSRSFTKKSLTIHFKDELGYAKFPLNVFKKYEGGVKARQGAHFYLRGSQEEGIFWAAVGMMKFGINMWHDYTMLDLGIHTPHSRFIFVYYNMEFKGIAHMREHHDNNYWNTYFGGNNSDYEIWTGARRIDTAPAAAGSPYSQFISAGYVFADQYVNWDSFIAYYVVTFYTANHNVWDGANYRLGGNTKAKTWKKYTSGYHFMLCDQDTSFMHTPNVDWGALASVYSSNRFWTVNSTHPVFWQIPSIGPPMGNMFGILAAQAHPDFMTRFYDMQWKLLWRPNATLSVAQTKERFNRIYTSFDLKNSLIPEFMRWGMDRSECIIRDPRAAVPYQEWIDTEKIMQDVYIPGRMAALRTQFGQKGWLNPLQGVESNFPDHSAVPSGTVITLTSNDAAYPSRAIIYTLNGEDPRIFGAGAGNTTNPNATRGGTTVSFPVTDTVIIYSRVFVNNSFWGPLEKLHIAVNASACLLCGNIIISEIHYHIFKPAVSVKGNKTPIGKFIEFKNIGSKPVVMTGSRVKPLQYKFPTLTLPPNGFWVISEYPEDFQKVYGRFPDDYFKGALTSNQNDIELRDSMDNTVIDISFHDNCPFSSYPDGEGFTLVARPENYTALASQVHWKRVFRFYRESLNKGGSPWSDDPSKVTTTVYPKITFVNYAKNKVAITVSNPSSAAIDISNWRAIRTSGKKSKHTFDLPAGTVLLPNQTNLVLPLGNMAMDDNDRIHLFKRVCCDAAGKYITTSDYTEFKPTLLVARHSKKRSEADEYEFESAHGLDKDDADESDWTQDKLPDDYIRDDDE